MDANSFERISEAAATIAAHLDGIKKDTLMPIACDLRKRVTNHPSNLDVDELVDKVWRLRQWMVQYTPSCDGYTFLANMKSMLAAIGEDDNVKVSFSEVGDDMWQKARSSLVDPDPTLEAPSLLAVSPPMLKRQGWKLARKHLSRLVRRVQRTLKTVAAPGVTWSGLRAIFIKNQWGDLCAKTFGLRRTESLLEVLYGMSIIELWYASRCLKCWCRPEFNDIPSWIPRHQLVVGGLQESKANIGEPRMTLKRSMNEAAWNGTLETGVTNGWRLALRRMSGALMETQVHDDTTVAEIRKSVACFFGVLVQQILLLFGEASVRDEDCVANFRGGELSVNVAPFENHLMPGSWTFLREGSEVMEKSGQNAMIDESQPLCVLNVTEKSNTARVIIWDQKQNKMPYDSSHGEEVTCPLDALIPALVPALRPLQVVPLCNDTTLSVFCFTSPGVGAHNTENSYAAHFEKDYYRGYSGGRDSAHLGHTFLPGSVVEVRISGDAPGGLCFSSKDQSRARIAHANILGPFDARLHQLDVRASDTELLRCVALPADPEEAARVLSHLRQLAEQAGLASNNVRLPAAFLPGFVHGQHVKRGASGQEGCIVGTQRGVRMYEMRHHGWSAIHRELQLP